LSGLGVYSVKSLSESAQFLTLIKHKIRQNKQLDPQLPYANLIHVNCFRLVDFRNGHVMLGCDGESTLRDKLCIKRQFKFMPTTNATLEQELTLSPPPLPQRKNEILQTTSPFEKYIKQWLNQ